MTRNRGLIISNVISTLIRKAARPALSLPRLIKCLIVLAVDISLCVLTVWLAFYLRLGEFFTLSGQVFWAGVISIAIALPIFVAFGLYRAIFRYSGLRAIYTLVRGIMAYGLLYSFAITVIGVTGIPRTVGIIQPLLLFVVLAFSRAVARYLLDWVNSTHEQVSVSQRALIYGAGKAGRQLASAFDSNSEMYIVGFLDDDDSLHGRVLNGQPIFSPNDLSDLIESKAISHILMAIPSISRRRRLEILGQLSVHQIAIRTLPSLTDLAEGRASISDLKDLDINDLLGRSPVTPDNLLLSKGITGRVVLVTGAGGSIGSELCRQIIKFNPEKLLLVDISEFALYAIHIELEEVLKELGGRDVVRIVPLLASVQDENRMREIMNAWLPQTVYHAAAYKHVPLVEHNLLEGVKNNVIGTLITAQVAIEKDVSDFVLISTDKAVRPTNVMGASKRLAELCIQALYAKQAPKMTNEESGARSRSIEPKHTMKTKMSMVRFGNVMDSSGSVIPKFRKQIRDGGPITLTHPEITRYFMTIPEAAQLVIQAGAMAKGGDVFLLDMGDSVKIADLARRMIELSGFSVRDEAKPDGDVDIVITGLRPGEKLYEEPVLGEDPQPTEHPAIQRARDPFIPWHQLKVDLETLNILIGQNDVIAILALLQKLVSGYAPSDEVVDWVFIEQPRKANGIDEPEGLSTRFEPSEPN